MNRSKEEDRLWKWFSRYIRARDTDDFGVCHCITCRKPGHPSEFDCGHFVKRDRYNLKYHEKNCHAQCPACNRFGDGEQGMYAVAIDRKYGTGTAESLLFIGKRTGSLKTWECAVQADHYRNKTYTALKNAGIDAWWKNK